MTLIQAITLSIAILGAILGLINTLHNLDKARVKIKVKPAHAIPMGAAPRELNFCIEITNLSSFPISISDAGFFYRGTKERGAWILPYFSDSGGHWPKRLEPRSSISVYAKTDCGVIKSGTSPAL